MYDQKRKDREFWLEIAKEALESHIEHLSNSIIYKLVLALSGEDFVNINNADAGLVDSPVIQSLINRGMTKEDIEELRKAGIDPSNIALIEHELE